MTPVRRSAYRDAKVRTILETADEVMRQGGSYLHSTS